MIRRLLLILIFHASMLSNAQALDESIDDEGPVVETQIDELIEVQKITYQKNSKASFCSRPPEMVDTIVVHHSETPSTSTAQDINAYHLNRGSAADPWYMIAYSFVINSPYEAATLPVPRVTEGRPIEIVGAHAGSNVFVAMDSTQTKLWAQKKILCGKENQKPKYDSTLVRNKKIKANVTTIGVVINGNYAPYLLPNGGGINPSGYDASVETRNPTPETIDMVARLSCQLQKQYPRIKIMAYHDQFHRTSCPGNFVNFMDSIKQKAKEYGCDFKLLSKRY